MKYVEKLKGLLEQNGALETEVRDLVVAQMKAVSILSQYYSSKESKALMRKAVIAEKQRIIPEGEIIFHVKLNPSANVFQLIVDLGLITSSCATKQSAQISKKGFQVDIELSVLLQSGLTPTTSTADVMLLDNLYNPEISIRKKIEMVYKKITLLIQ
ncbi:MAG: hypothetical protein WCG55_03425 [bacterium]